MSMFFTFHQLSKVNTISVLFNDKIIEFYQIKEFAFRTVRVCYPRDALLVEIVADRVDKTMILIRLC